MSENKGYTQEEVQAIVKENESLKEENAALKAVEEANEEKTTELLEDSKRNFKVSEKQLNEVGDGFEKLAGAYQVKNVTALLIDGIKHPISDFMKDKKLQAEAVAMKHILIKKL